MPRYLKKIDDGSLYVWTPELAKRSDMIEVATASAEDGPVANASSTPAPEVPQGGDGAGDQHGSTDGTGSSTANAIDPLTITDKDELKRLLAERGVKLAGNPSLTTLQVKLAEALKGGDGAGD